MKKTLSILFISCGLFPVTQAQISCANIQQYVAGSSSYGGGTQVQNYDKVYTCINGPGSAWCTLAGYEPGKPGSTVWQSAWTEDDVCSQPTVVLNAPGDGNSYDFFPLNIDFDVTAPTGATISSVVLTVVETGGSSPITISTNNSGDNYTTTWSPTTSGDYTFEITAIDNNGDTKVETFTITATGVGISNDLEKYGISLFPNPYKGSFSITSENQSNINEIHVFDNLGNSVKVYKQTDFSNIGTDLNTGLYMLKIVTDDKILITKLIKK
jgi:hypothetical protein